ncbi:MAG TPA: single-stranded DNA-binding protein [Mycobacteriales bacterium]|nr:single-stranded DNA-binding protein [Mycobacteriales bacterium]
MNLAQIVIVGNVVSDPECRTLTDGQCRTRFRVAATSRTLDARSGRWRDGETTFLAVVAWRGLAAAAAAGLRRGARVVVVGHLRQYDYARDGQRELGYEVQAQEIAIGLTSGRPHPSGPPVERGDARSSRHIEQ